MSETSVAPSAEMRFVASAARRRIGAAEAAELRSLLDIPVSWPLVLAAAERHRVEVLLLRSLETLDDPRVPPGFLAGLREHSRRVHRSNLVLCVELLRCLEILDRADVPALPYKGPVLGVVAYGDPGARVFGDLDIVLRRDDAPRAFDALSAAGYRIDHPIAPGRAERFFRFHCQHGFQGASGVRVELHWALLPAYLSISLDPYSLWKRRTMVPLAGREVPHFGAEDLVLVLSAHGYKHFWSRLEWVTSLAEVLRAHPGLDGDALLARARSAGAERILGLALRLAAEVAAAPVPAPCRLIAFHDPAVADCVRAARRLLFAPEERRPGFWRRSRLRLRARERPRDRVGYWFHLAAGMEPVETWMREPGWRAADPLLRPVRLLQVLLGRGRRGEGP